MRQGKSIWFFMNVIKLFSPDARFPLKIHHIQFRCESSQRSPRLSSWIWGKRKGKGERREKGKGKEGWERKGVDGGEGGRG